MAKAEAAAEGQGRDLKKIITFAFVALNVVGVAVGAYLVYTATIGYVPPVRTIQELNAELEKLKKELTAEPKVLYSMDTFNTNLNGLPRKFIRMEMSIEMYDQRGFEEIISKEVKARDSVMRIVNAKQLEDIDSVQGKLQLKTEIVAKLNDLLDHGVVKGVYFTKFQVQ
jgi:flagellar FliL protein